EVVSSLVSERVPWRILDGELVPASAPVAVRTEEMLAGRHAVFDFSGETFEADPSAPGVPLVAGVGDLAKAIEAARSGDRDGARAALASVVDTRDPQIIYAVAWCWHWIAEDRVAFDAIVRAHAGW